ncbi:hypothetical protein OM076_00545 [Solirubrobacter ginsenosidimutans]|uniref:Uncharacterized protein n=1 Tax=Solirubrobacter ginsenosidimutans TaxID=490573 RepID=A0A9X3MPA2_9ACTN|nr:hypothetical protein [Solirubrobacter ginsenosidimutans]MDA0158735.1 hypothetical protein [Solirubrobacter ginsenosidimutans]
MLVSEVRRVIDAIACVVVAFGVAALLGLDPFSGAVEFVITALLGGAVYGVILIICEAARHRFGRS